MFKAKTNVSHYTGVLEKYGRARGKTNAEVVQRAAQQSNFKMVASENRGGVRRAKLGMFPLNATGDPSKGGTTYKNRFFYAHQASFGVKKGAGGNIVMRPAAYRAWTKRRSAKGAMAAGFLRSARQLGLRKRGAKSVQPRSGGSASKSIGRKPRGRKMMAISVNMVEGSFEVGSKTMDNAIRRTITDMNQFANKLIQELNDRTERG